jgi:hypothetical protein
MSLGGNLRRGGSVHGVHGELQQGDRVDDDVDTELLIEPMARTFGVPPGVLLR